MRANFTQENVKGMTAFDPELARKAQIALDHKLPINFQQLELIEESLPRLLEEKTQLEALRAEVTKLPPGKYDMPQVDISAARPVPGQKDLQGTLGELAEVLHPGLIEKTTTPPKSLGK